MCGPDVRYAGYVGNVGYVGHAGYVRYVGLSVDLSVCKSVSVSVFVFVSVSVSVSLPLSFLCLSDDLCVSLTLALSSAAPAALPV